MGKDEVIRIGHGPYRGGGQKSGLRQREGAHDAGVVTVPGGDDELNQASLGGDEVVLHVTPQLLFHVCAHFSYQRLALQHAASKDDALRGSHHDESGAQPADVVRRRVPPTRVTPNIVSSSDRETIA